MIADAQLVSGARFTSVPQAGGALTYRLNSSGDWRSQNTRKTHQDMLLHCDWARSWPWRLILYNSWNVWRFSHAPVCSTISFYCHRAVIVSCVPGLQPALLPLKYWPRSQQSHMNGAAQISSSFGPFDAVCLHVAVCCKQAFEEDASQSVHGVSQLLSTSQRKPLFYLYLIMCVSGCVFEWAWAWKYCNNLLDTHTHTPLSTPTSPCWTHKCIEKSSRVV